MLEPQEPLHMNISQKRNTAWVYDIIQETKSNGAQEGSTKHRKNPKPFLSYVALMCDLVDK